MRNNFVLASVLIAAVGCGQPATPPIPTSPKVVPASSSVAPETHVTQEDVKREVEEAAKTGAEKAWDALRVGFDEAAREVEPAPAAKPAGS